jgi:hypothetical protein
MESPSGATEFTFRNDRIATMAMRVAGPLDYLQDNLLPHEVTHAVLAHHFGRAIPRWVDEGMATRAEDTAVRGRQDARVRKLVKQNTLMPLATLFALRDYPSNTDDVMRFYAQGYSVTDYLIRARGRRTLLTFVEKGMESGWAKAAQSCYGHDSIEKLEQAWLTDLRETAKAATPLIAAGAVEVHGIDGSIVKGTLKEDKIELATPYGKMLIPIGDIHKIELGVRPSAEERDRIEAAIDDLDRDAKRKDAADTLLELKEKAYPALVRAAKNKDARAGRAAEVLKKLKTRVPEEILEAVSLDVIHTANSKIAGRLQVETLRLSTALFGEQPMNLAGVRSVRSQAHIEERAAPINPPPPPFPRAVPLPEPPSIREQYWRAP